MHTGNTAQTSRRPRKKILIAVVGVAILIVITGLTLLSVWLATRKDALDLIGIPVIEIDESRTSVVDKTDDYLGHPDLVLTQEGKLIAAYPAGHGKGEILIKESDDLGETWSARRSDLPRSFADSQEPPTLYALDFNDGSQKLLLVSGCPSWNDDDEYYADGFNFSLSSDGGKTWSEFTNAYGAEWASSMPKQGDASYIGVDDASLPNFDTDGSVLPYDVIVAMSSLTRLKDENGNYLDKWMGTFHDYDFFNYTSILSFDENGTPIWSAPRKFLYDQRETELASNLCELEIFRTSDDDLILLGRSNSRTCNAMISVSSDEGKTWSKLKELPYSLTGDRHKAEYDAVSGKMIVSFRLYLPSIKPHALSAQNGLGGYWVAWVGEPSDLVDYALDANKDKSSALGDAMLVLGKTNDGASDCGYSGTVCKDGTFVLASYGKFRPGVSEPYIMQVKFKLADVMPS